MGQKRPTKRQLLQQNEELTRQLDSMKALLQDYEERLRVDDSLHGEVLRGPIPVNVETTSGSLTIRYQ